jgi:GH25 family lysozyme M1 (1,4-beta-N-acetylmuramidase)
VEEHTMDDMNGGVEAFRQIRSLGAKTLVFMSASILWKITVSMLINLICMDSTYGVDSGYYNAAPSTDLDYDLHQYTSRGYVNGFENYLDLNIITTLKDPNEVYRKLFTTQNKMIQFY